MALVIESIHFRILKTTSTLRKFLEARERGASESELKALQIADEAARSEAEKLRQKSVVEFSPYRALCIRE